MVKNDLVKKISRDQNMSQAAARRVVESFIQAITKTLSRGENVTLPNFGTFTIAKRAMRRCRNPQTGKIMTIPARRAAKFKPGKKLAESVNQ